MRSDVTAIGAHPVAGLNGFPGHDVPPIGPGRSDGPHDDMSFESPALLPSPGVSAGEIAYATAENRDLRAEVDRLRAERDRLATVQRSIMELLGTKDAARLLHDLRNVLNERELYRALADCNDEE